MASFRKTIFINIVILSIIGCSDTYEEKNTNVSKSLNSLNRSVSFLTDTDGMTLYTFDNDTLNKSNCDAECQKKWPLFLGANSESSDIKVIEGTDHLTYRQHPLYYFFNDIQVGDINGDNVNNIWHLVYAPDGSNDFQTKLSTQKMKQTYLTDDEGRALYTFDNDTENVSNCYAKCEDTWPIYYNENIKNVPQGMNKADFTTISRDEAKSTTGVLKQTAYKGKPLYYFTPDNKEFGAFRGDWVKGVWHLIEIESIKEKVDNNNNEKIEKGKERFAKGCNSCHGADGKTPALGVSQIIANIGDATEIEFLLRNMKDNGDASGKHPAMVSVASTLSDDEIINLSAFIATLNK